MFYKMNFPAKVVISTVKAVIERHLNHNSSINVMQWVSWIAYTPCWLQTAALHTLSMTMGLSQM